MTITPDMAVDWLTRNYSNRSLKTKLVEAIAGDIREGNWRLNGESIIFEGAIGESTLVDGQHRLWAVVEADQPIDTFVVGHVGADVMQTIDTGRARTFGDVAHMAGRKNATLLAATARLLWWHENRQSEQPKNLRLSHSTLLDFLAGRPDIEDRVAEVANHNKIKRLFSNTEVAFVYYHAYQENPERAADWLELLGSGSNLEAGHPIFLVRERFLTNRTATTAKLEQIPRISLLVQSWHMFIENRRGVRLRLDTNLNPTNWFRSKAGV